MAAPLVPLGEIQPTTTPQTGAGTGSLTTTIALPATTTILNPIQHSQDADFLTVQGVRSPGVIPKGGITGHDRENKWDVKEGKGTKGATTTYVGQPPVKFSVKFNLWTVQHFADLEKFLPVVRFDPTKDPSLSARSIYHPWLAPQDIVSVVTTKIGGIVHEGEGLYSVTIEFLEYKPAPKTNATATPAATKYTTGKNDPNGTGTPGNTVDPAVTALQRQAAVLAKQAQDTA
jgi:hypothetical protein